VAADYYGGVIYTSADGGVTWTERTTGPRSPWSVASSVDGTRLVAVENGGFIYTSTDSGATWTERTAAGSRNWWSVASSGNGNKLAAVDDFESIYTSDDYGATWTKQESAGIRAWEPIATSADGTTLISATWGGYIYTSTDSGATWTERTAAGSRNWASVASSADGTKLIAAEARGGHVYTSADSGTTWTQQIVTSMSDWIPLSISADGSKLAAGVDGGNIYLATTEPPATATQGMASLPTGSKDATAGQAVAQASLAATSMSCYTLTPGSVSTLGPDSLVVPESGITLLGGVAFSLDCTSTGGSADTSITLGTNYADTSNLRVYKRSGTGPLVDITRQVTIQNESGKTVIRYTLTDGGAWDEDSTANSTIVDPIYIGVVNGAATTTPGATGGSLANTGLSVYLVTALAGTLLVSAGVVWRKGLKLGRRVSFR
jgi:phage pi2 protein 07